MTNVIGIFFAAGLDVPSIDTGGGSGGSGSVGGGSSLWCSPYGVTGFVPPYAGNSKDSSEFKFKIRIRYSIFAGFLS